jgi:hypothetical protein
MWMVLRLVSKLSLKPRFSIVVSRTNLLLSALPLMAALQGRFGYVHICYLYNIIYTLHLLILAFLGIGNITSLGILFIVFVFIFDTIYLWFMLQVRAHILV